MRLLLRAFVAVKKGYTGKHSLVVNTVTSGVLGTVGDIVAQRLEQKSEILEWDAKRTRHMTIMNLLLGPVMHYWYRFLDMSYPGHSFKMISRKLCLDMLSSPVWYAWFIGGLSLLQGNNFTQMLEGTREKVPIMLTFDFALWPVFQIFNFKFFAPQYRVLGVKCNELVLNGISSHVAYNEYTFCTFLDAIQRVLVSTKK